MKCQFKMKGLDCANCANKLENEFRKIGGIKEVSVNFMAEKLTFECKEEQKEKILKQIQNIIKKEEPEVSLKEESNEKKELKKNMLKIIVSSIFLLSALVLKNPILYILSYAIVGYEVLFKAIRNSFHLKLFDENFLMAVATIGAFFIQEYPEAVTVMLFYQIGEWFQDYAVDKSRRTVTSLVDMRGDHSVLAKTEKKVLSETVKIGEVILVKPGEKVPLDGIVIEGESMLNTSALTGEAVPRRISSGEEILSGMIVLDGSLKIKVTKTFQESTVSKILDLIENASTRKSKSENFISKFARYYTPTVVLIALLLCIVPMFILENFIFQDWLYRSLSFLVVSCPCALVISIPLSFFSGIGASSKIGVLIKGSNYLEALANTELIACDKTGTLTEGTFEVKTINAINNDPEEVLKYAVMAESLSNHPIANSLKKAYPNKIDQKKVTNVRERAGYGISACIEKEKVLVGNEKLMQENNIPFKKDNQIGTVIYVAVNGLFKGSVTIADPIKKDCFDAIAELKKTTKKIVMLSGDQESICLKVKETLHLDDYKAELLPQGKVAYLEELLKETSSNGKLMFIGDGMNDAPVLARADIGVAMGGLGSDAAIEAADVVVMNDELSKIAPAIKIAKKTLRIVKENIFFAITVKILVLLLSAFGFSTMWTAVFADVGVSVLAVFNSLRIFKRK